MITHTHTETLHNHTHRQCVVNFNFNCWLISITSLKGVCYSIDWIDFDSILVVSCCLSHSFISNSRLSTRLNLRHATHWVHEQRADRWRLNADTNAACSDTGPSRSAAHRRLRRTRTRTANQVELLLLHWHAGKQTASNSNPNSNWRSNSNLYHARLVVWVIAKPGMGLPWLGFKWVTTIFKLEVHFLLLYF